MVLCYISQVHLSKWLPENSIWLVHPFSRQMSLLRMHQCTPVINCFICLFVEKISRDVSQWQLLWTESGWQTFHHYIYFNQIRSVSSYWAFFTDQFAPKNIRTFAPQSILACEHSFSGAVVLRSIWSLELSLPVTFAVLHSMRLLIATGGLIIVLNTVLYLIVVYALSSNSPVLFCLM